VKGGSGGKEEEKTGSITALIVSTSSHARNFA